MENLRRNLEEIIQNEVSLGGSPTINVTLELGYNFDVDDGIPYIIREDIKYISPFGQE